jgi:hypothetical protein
MTQSRRRFHTGGLSEEQRARVREGRLMFPETSGRELGR